MLGANHYEICRINGLFVFFHMLNRNFELNREYYHKFTFWKGEDYSEDNNPYMEPAYEME
ncbi:hypothetical protein JCM10914A_29430 [Paenibacillus sp. JCM 10914]